MDRRRAGIPPPGCGRRGRRVAVTAITSFVVQRSWDVGPRLRNGPPARASLRGRHRKCRNPVPCGGLAADSPAAGQPEKRPVCETAP